MNGPPPSVPDLDEPGVVDAFLAGSRASGVDRPWVMANMVASVDGATAVDGESRGLSGPADRLVFHRLRAMADVVLAGAATVRADRYGPAVVTDDVRAQRVSRGQAATPAVAVVSRSLRLEWGSPLFTGAQNPTIVIGPRGAATPPATVRHLATGDGRDVDLGEALRVLAGDGAGVVLCEGGPGLLAQLAAGGLLDELFLTVSPLLVGGDAQRVLRGAAVQPPRTLRLAGMARAGDMLFLRYLVA